MKPYADNQWEALKRWPRACWRMSRRLRKSGKVKDNNPEPKRKRVWIERDFAFFVLQKKHMVEVIFSRPEPGWSNHDQDEAWVTPSEGPNRPMLKNRRMSCG